MREELIMMGPEYWSVPDLDRPTPDCVMPEPIRPPESVGVWYTCSHCGITFILADISDGQDGWRSIWVNSHQHTRMCDAVDRIFWSERDFCRE